MQIRGPSSSLSHHMALAAPAFRRVMYFGAITNLLVLMPSVYMLEVYGRVVSSRSHVTLGMLTLLVVAAYIWLEVLEWLRSQMLHQTAAQMDTHIAPSLFVKLFDAHLLRRGGAHASANQDWALLRSFMASPAMVAALDAPFALVVVLILFFINPWLGFASICVACFLALVGWLTDRGIRGHLADAARTSALAQNFATGAMRQSEVITAMGMQADMYAIWKGRQDAFLLAQARASDHAGSGAAASKLVQTLQASLMLGLGCWLTLEGSLEPSGGMMIVGSVLGGRVLAPLVQIVTQWRSVVNVRDAWQRLDTLLTAVPPRPRAMPLPPPRGLLQVESLVAGAPNGNQAIIKNVAFTLPIGEVLAVVGPSAAGKTTLARLLVGLWPAMGGKVRLDGADIFTWDKTELGPHIGYLPQGVELLEGTLAENIARFGELEPAKIKAAATAVGLHEFIMSLPQGYDSAVGREGAMLSGGQRQRVALARAIYGDPVLVVLDEPNSSLDEAGDAALAAAILEQKSRGTTFVIMTHRTSVLAVADKMLVLRDGVMQAFGQRDEVLAALKQASEKAATQSRQASSGGLTTA